MREAVAALIVKKREQRILAISRGLLHPFNMGLPGGKVEPGEKLVDAVVREVYEETGIEVVGVKAVYRRVCDGPKDFDTTVFTARDFFGRPRTMGVEGWVRWVRPEELLSGRFGKYNRAMLAHVRENGILDF